MKLKETTMANSMSFLMILSLLAFAPLCLCQTEGRLDPHFYDNSCPRTQQIVNSVLAKVVVKEPRMAASLLRLHFLDCFVMGCDGSLFLESSGSIISEKESNPNRDSARGFEVIDEIKAALEKECPHIVTCVDISALAARDSVVLVGGPSWKVPLGRRDSLNASLSDSNNNIQEPNNTYHTILNKFKLQGLEMVDQVALAEAHTLGYSKCTYFKHRLYNHSGNGKLDPILDQHYATELRTRCPKFGGDRNLSPLDYVTPSKFDNSYFKNLLDHKGLLYSDQVLFTMNQELAKMVKLFAKRNDIFFEQFAKSMIKLGNLSPLTGSKGEIRRNCRKINT